MAPTRAALPLLLFLVAGGVYSDEATHKYAKGERLWVYGNKIGPFNNPLETYGYFDILPWCDPHSTVPKKPTLGEALVGDELMKLGVDLKFTEDKPDMEICNKILSPKDIKIFEQAVKEQYWYQLYIDELPVWAALGKTNSKTNRPYIYTHQRFSLGYNGDRVVTANLTAERKWTLPPPDAPEADRTVRFTYSIEWAKSDVKFETRFRRYLDETFFEHKIHWVSVLNSFMMVFVLACIVLFVLLQTLRADYARYNKASQDEEAEFNEDSGWKQVHAEVFRVPPNHVWLCALVGTGWQLLVLIFCLITIAIVSVVHEDRGALLTYSVISYAVTSSVAGYSSGRQFVRYATAGPAISKDWKMTMFYTAALFPGLVGATAFALNLIAIMYNSQQAIPFATMVAMVLIWLLVSLPLVVLGTLIGRHQKKHSVPRVSQIPRSIPEKWKHYHLMSMLVGGLLSFGSIFIELYFVFTSFWNYKFYYVYGFMLLVYVILILVTMCLSVVFTYYLLNSEDYRWQWSSFFVGASTAGYIFVYSIYFFLVKTRMSGFFMTAFYFGYMSMFCCGMAILCGTVSFISSDIFVRRIYHNIKSD